jgi:hypothetical protein
MGRLNGKKEDMCKKSHESAPITDPLLEIISLKEDIVTWIQDIRQHSSVQPTTLVCPIPNLSPEKLSVSEMRITDRLADINMVLFDPVITENIIRNSAITKPSSIQYIGFGVVIPADRRHNEQHVMLAADENILRETSQGHLPTGPYKTMIVVQEKLPQQPKKLITVSPERNYFLFGHDIIQVDHSKATVLPTEDALAMLSVLVGRAIQQPVLPMSV